LATFVKNDRMPEPDLPEPDQNPIHPSLYNICLSIKVKGSFDITALMLTFADLESAVDVRCCVVCQYQPPKIKKAPAQGYDSYAGGYDDDYTMRGRTTGNYGNTSSMSTMPVFRKF